MKKIIFIFTTIIAISAFGNNSAKANENSFKSETATIFFSSEDQSLGKVNLCDPAGNVCHTADAYRDSENGRIYVYLYGTKLYAQGSNDSRWRYMVRDKDKWLYFSF